MLGLELGDSSLLLDDGLPCLGLSQRTLLLRLVGRLVDLGLVTGLLDLGVASRFGDLRQGHLFLGNCLALGVGAGDAGVLLDLSLVGHREVFDVGARARNRLDLETVDDEPE